jgi:hypothetical protein
MVRQQAALASGQLTRGLSGVNRPPSEVIMSSQVGLAPMVRTHWVTTANFMRLLSIPRLRAYLGATSAWLAAVATALLRPVLDILAAMLKSAFGFG